MQTIPLSTSKRGAYLNMYGPWNPQACAAMMNARLYRIKVSSMPTAILMVYTPDGFVAISDGKGNPIEKLPSLHEQKVFNLRSHSLNLMYGVSGAASILDEDGKTDILKQAYQPVLQTLASQEFSTLASYADAVMDTLGPKLHEILKADAPLRDWGQDPEEYKFKIQFAGYFKGVAAIAERRISFWREKWCVTDTKDFCPAHPADYSLVGSEPVVDIVSGAGNQFLQYKTPGLTKLKKNDRSISQKEAIDAGREYIKACMTPEARGIDPCVCNSIGGDIWKATLAENGDFDVCVLVPFNDSV